MPKKPDGLGEFERLMAKLAKVPKAELDQKVAQYEARKEARKRKKKADESSQ